MKSFAIKTNNSEIKEDLIFEFEQINMKDFYLSDKKFKVFDNIILHYSGNEIINFIDLVSESIANIIQKFYDDYFINKIISRNYFYILPNEQEGIKRITYKILSASRVEQDIGKEILKNLVFEYLIENKTMILDGFVNFRIKEYIDTLDYIVELAVASYLNIMI